jgi:EAL domain-containing protein (putative c-di-GMP-specific phosphodiesterase class I)
VETATQLARLREMGCDEIQGYLFSRPVPAEEMTHLLQSGESLSLALEL